MHIAQLTSVKLQLIQLFSVFKMYPLTHSIQIGLLDISR